MAQRIVVPRLGWSMDEGVFAGWLKRDGERVHPGDPLFLVENEKATAEVESLDGGILRVPDAAPREGDSVRVGQVLGFIVAEGEDMPEELEDASSLLVASETRAADGAPPNSRPEPDSDAPAEELRLGESESGPTMTPRAARLARSLGVDWLQVEGTGRSGRIRERDIRAAAQRGPSADS